MLASKNLLKPASGEPIILPGKDMVLGVYYPDTRRQPDPKRAMEGLLPIFDEVILAYNSVR
jgi:DNA-directed RNA polymerase subunit beta'